MKEIVTYYLENGYNFQKYYPQLLAHDTQNVFLIHGWGVRAPSMENLSKALSLVGYMVYNYDYPTSTRTIQDHAVEFLKLYRNTLKEEHIESNISFVTHSMGGLVLRSAMADMTEEECRKINAIVMLGPPNRGSRWARFGLSTFMRKHNKSLADMLIGEQSFVNKIPAPKYLPPVGIIAGRFDGKVALPHTALPEGQPFELAIVNCSHPGLRRPSRTLGYIAKFLRTKHF